MTTFDDVEGNGLVITRKIQITEAGVKHAATVATYATTATATITARGQDDRAVKRRACRDIAGGGRALLNPDSRAVI
eukprot:evm.model.NODE_10672_length_49929_cov_32.751286.10